MLGGEQELAQLGTVETAEFRRVDLGSAHVGFAEMRPSM